jgi:hypothetical protein
VASGRLDCDDEDYEVTVEEDGGGVKARSLRKSDKEPQRFFAYYKKCEVKLDELRFYRLSPEAFNADGVMFKIWCFPHGETGKRQGPFYRGIINNASPSFEFFQREKAKSLEFIVEILGEGEFFGTAHLSSM